MIQKKNTLKKMISLITNSDSNEIADEGQEEEDVEENGEITALVGKLLFSFALLKLL